MSTSYIETVRAAFRTKLRTIKTASTTSSLLAQGAHTFTRDTGDGSFITDGWVVGMTGKIADSGTNNGATFTVSGTVTALILTVTETLNAQSKAQVGACILTSTFRNTVSDVYEDIYDNGVRPYIELGFGPMRLVPTDSAWKIYDVFIDVRIICEIEADKSLAATSTLVAAQDSLIHDVFRCIAELYSENVCAVSGARWHILKDPPVTVSTVFPDNEGAAWFGINLTLKIRNLDSSFND